MAVYFDPAIGKNSGNLMNAIGAWDHYFGPESKRLDQQLQDSKIAVQLHANDLENSNLDLADRKGGMTTFGQAEPDLRIPTTQMTQTPGGQYDRWVALATKNGVKDIAKYGQVWNQGALGTWGKVSTPQGGMATEFQSGPNGINAGGIILPPQVQSPQTPPGASSTPDFSGAGKGPVGVQSPQSQPAQSGASAPSGSGDFAVPDLTPQEALVPYFRQWHDYQISQAAKKQELAKGSQELEKNQREIQLGTPEEQKRYSDFSSGAQELSKNLLDLESTVAGTRGGQVDSKAKYPAKNSGTDKDGKQIVEDVGAGNWELKDPDVIKNLNLLPKQIAENWKHINNPGGAPLKPGQEDRAAESVIPMPGALGPFDYQNRNSVTTGAIRDNEQRLADKVKQYENDASTRLPILNLDPKIRALIGPPPQRLIDAAAAQGKDVSEFTSQEKEGFKSMDDFNAARKAGTVDKTKPAIVNGTAYVMTPQGWIPQQ